jgi:hypothetical protein
MIAQVVLCVRPKLISGADKGKEPSKKPGTGCRARRASSIHEKLPDKPALTNRWYLEVLPIF